MLSGNGFTRSSACRRLRLRAQSMYNFAMATRYIIGCMTGTSLDGLDAALVRIDGEGLAMKAALVDLISCDMPSQLREELRSFAQGSERRPLDYMRAARELGAFHADTIEQLIARQGPNHPPIDFVVAHGQTIWHAPNDDAGQLSWQLFDPWPIVHRLKLPVCYDLRQADLIAGGQGAPITPLADLIMFGHPTRSRLIVNLGGIINVTHLPANATPDQITGGDVGPCNILLDGLAQRLLDRPYDEHGAVARTGDVSTTLNDLLLQADQPGIDADEAIDAKPRSLGRENYDDAWLDGIARAAADAALPPHDALATASQYVAMKVRNSASAHRPDDIILAGGGAKNLDVASRIARSWVHANTVVSDDLGVPVEAREAMAFAILGALSQDGVPITLPQITGSTNPGCAGVWAYP